MEITKHKIRFKKFAMPYVQTGQLAYKVKTTHSGDVLKIISTLSQLIGFDKKQTYLAQLTALYHDLGRFIQYAKFQTFNDAISIDHAAESVKIIQQHEFLKELDPTDQVIILTAIAEHSKKEISSDIASNSKPIVLLIRDADKLSNFPLLIKNYQNISAPIAGVYRESLIEDILHKRPISNSDRLSVEDFHLYHLSWFNDLNYRQSLLYAQNHGYLQAIINMIAISEIKELIAEHFNNLLLLKSLS